MNNRKIDIMSIKKNIYRERTLNYPLSTKWMRVYIFILFPIGIYADIAMFFGLTAPMAIDGKTGILGLLFLIFCLQLIFIISTYRDMKALRESGYIKNIVLLLLVTSSQPISFAIRSEFFTGFIDLIFLSLIWFLPNYIYFKKRKSLFYPLLYENIKIEREKILIESYNPETLENISDKKKNKLRELAIQRNRLQKHISKTSQATRDTQGWTYKDLERMCVEGEITSKERDEYVDTLYNLNQEIDEATEMIKVTENIIKKLESEIESMV
jgi:hypothetical protein